jgi:hypothetical protein
VFALAVGYAAYYHAVVHTMPDDDAYITYRYAENLAKGKGLVYNTGERVFGCSSPLYCVWLAGWEWAIPALDMPSFSVRSNFMFFIASGAVLAALLYRFTLSAGLALVAGSIFLVHPTLLDASCIGMESFLFCSLLLGAILALSHGRFAIGGLLAGLSIVVRPEGVLVVPLFALPLCRSTWRTRWIIVMALAAAPLAWGLFACSYFGTPIPHSVIAKARPLYPLPAGAAIDGLMAHLAEWSFGNGRGARGMDILVAAALAICGLAAVFRKGYARPMEAGPFVVLLFFLALYGVTNPALFPWYLPPVFLLWFVALLVGVFHLTRRLVRAHADSVPDRSRNAQMRRLAPAVIAGLCLVCPLWTTVSVHKAAMVREKKLVPSLHYRERERTYGYKDCAQWLKEHASHSAVVLTAEIGALGYYWDGKLIDACALVSPEALSYLPVPASLRGHPMTSAIHPDLVRNTLPDYVVSHPVFIQTSLIGDAWFEANYTLVANVRMPRVLWGHNSIFIYRRSGVPAHQKPTDRDGP